MTTGAETPAATPALRQYREAKDRYPEAVLFFRMGDFFELFFEDAELAAPIMGVTLTSRPMGKSGRSPMCGVPHHAWQASAGKLLRAGHSVVICDQLEAPTGKAVVKRDVTRVLTPGTVLEEAYLEPGRSNYLVAAWTRGGSAGVAACELGAGELLLCELPAERLPAELDRLAPAELLTPPAVEAYRFEPDRGARLLRELLGIGHPAAAGAADAPLAVGAAGVVLDHLRRSQVRVEPGLLRVRTYSPDATMQLDPATVRNLELGALLRLLDRASTPLGSRRLRAWLWAPLRDVESIEMRLAAVAELAASPPRRARLEPALKPVGDLERLVSRAAQGLASPRELVALRRSLEALTGVAAAAAGVDAFALRSLAGTVSAAPDLADTLAAALVEDPPALAREGGAIRSGFDAELDAIRGASKDAREWISALEATERERTGIRSLKVGFNRVFGYYLEVGHAHTASVPDDYIRKQTLTGAERYITPAMKEREAIVLNAQQHAAARELQILKLLSEKVADQAADLLATAQAIGELDAICALAANAAERGWARPVIAAAPLLHVRGGRHPVVEASLPAGSFVPNDLELDSEAEQVVVLTGPNMAGKSTYLRMAALVVVMAQCGSFVPADEATVGVADRVFTRVGAHDDLASGMSTFMVEMTECAAILAGATRSSLVVFDEVGRGTSTYDGISIATSVVEYVHDRIGCRTLFATHYHELTALAERLDHVANHRVEVLEEGERVRFLHRVVPGGADRSYGIHVAALAGLPPTVIARAQQVLAELERQRPLEPAEQQLGLPLEAPADPVRAELRDLDLDHLSPLEALQKLYQLRARMAGDSQ